MSAAGAEDWLLGIEIGGTKLQLGLGRADGSLAALERLGVDPARGAKGILDQIEAAIRTLLHRMMLSPHDVARDRRGVRRAGGRGLGDGCRPRTRSRAGPTFPWPTGSAGDWGSRPS